MKDIPRSYLIGGGIVILLLLVVTGFILTKSKGQKAAQTTDTTQADEQEQVIPTVDSSVKVSIEPSEDKREVSLSITSLPKGTESVEYIISYNTEQQGLQGLNGIVTVDSGETEIQKKLTVGTCSSGTCVYHHVVGTMKVELKFSGSYGERVFEKEFPFK